MTIATDYSSCTSHNYRPGPVRTSFCCCYKYVLLCPYREQENGGHWDVTDPTMNLGVSATNYFSVPYRKVITQIPIAQLSSMTAWLRPAVSSLEACQTPAR
jgi:hypothetical protein